MYRGNPQRSGQSLVDTASITGNPLWTFNVGAAGSPPVSAPSQPPWGNQAQTLYTADQSGNLLAVNPDGTQKWSVALLPGPEPAAEIVVGADGTIYAAMHDYQTLVSTVFALTPDAQVKWSFQPKGIFEPIFGAGGLVIAPDSTLYLTDTCNILYALTPSGDVKWEFTAYESSNSGSCDNYSSISAPSLGRDGTIYFGLDFLAAVSPGGEFLWQTSPLGIAQTPPVIGPLNTIYVTGGENARPDTLYAVDLSGTTLWSKTFSYNLSRPAVANDSTIYLANDFNGFWAINPDGSVKWNVPGTFLDTPPTIGEDGTIYEVQTYGGFYPEPEVDKLEAFTSGGVLTWSQPVSPTSELNEPEIGGDGTIYYLNGQGTLYAFH